MTPTSALAGILTGLLDGTLIAIIVVVGAYVVKRRQQAVPIVHPVAEELPRHKTPIGELPTLD